MTRKEMDIWIEVRHGEPPRTFFPASALFACKASDANRIPQPKAVREADALAGVRVPPVSSTKSDNKDTRK